jgi:dihydrofolate reductase
MSKVRASISASLDGYIAGPNASVTNPLGDRGEDLHQWVFGLESWRRQHGMEGGETGVDSDVVKEEITNVGAVIMGRNMFDEGEGPWGDEPPFHNPVFIVTHRPRDAMVRGETTYNFVTDGVESSVAQARQAAGGKDISVAGGANIIRGLMAIGALDELEIHVVPLLLGGGTRLFEGDSLARVELVQDRVIGSRAVTHLRYRLNGR